MRSKFMTNKVSYRSSLAPLDDGGKTQQFFEIEQVPGKIRGLREFRFKNMFQVSNGSTFDNIANLNVSHLRNLLALLRQMENDGFLDNEYI